MRPKVIQVPARPYPIVSSGAAAEWRVSASRSGSGAGPSLITSGSGAASPAAFVDATVLGSPEAIRPIGLSSLRDPAERSRFVQPPDTSTRVPTAGDPLIQLPSRWRPESLGTTVGGGRHIVEPRSPWSAGPARVTDPAIDTVPHGVWLPDRCPPRGSGGEYRMRAGSACEAVVWRSREGVIAAALPDLPDDNVQLSLAGDRASTDPVALALGGAHLAVVYLVGSRICLTTVAGEVAFHFRSSRSSSGRPWVFRRGRWVRVLYRSHGYLFESSIRPGGEVLENQPSGAVHLRDMDLAAADPIEHDGSFYYVGMDRLLHELRHDGDGWRHTNVSEAGRNGDELSLLRPSPFEAVYGVGEYESYLGISRWPRSMGTGIAVRTSSGEMLVFLKPSNAWLALRPDNRYGRAAGRVAAVTSGLDIHLVWRTLDGHLHRARLFSDDITRPLSTA